MSPKKFPWSRYPLAWYYAKLMIVMEERRWPTRWSPNIYNWLIETYGIPPEKAHALARVLKLWYTRDYVPQALLKVGACYYLYCRKVEGIHD